MPTESKKRSDTTARTVAVRIPSQIQNRLLLLEAIRIACKPRFSGDPLKKSVAESLDRIGDADVLVADVTQHDPVVTHDVGLAHTLHVPVLCVCHYAEKSRVADLEGLRIIYYGELEKPEEWERLTGVLRVRIPAATGSADRRIMTDSFAERALWITSDLNRLAKEYDAESQTFWYSGFLSDFAVSKEGLEPGERPFEPLLMAQRKAMEALADKGARMNCILKMPDPQHFWPESLNVMTIRLRCLRDYVEADKKSSQAGKHKIYWVVSPYRHKNFYIIGDISCIERYQKAAFRGVDLTLRLTDAAAVAANKMAYDALFKRHMKANIMAYDELFKQHVKAPCAGDANDEALTICKLREYTLFEVEKAIRFLEEQRKALGL